MPIPLPICQWQQPTAAPTWRYQDTFNRATSTSLAGFPGASWGWVVFGGAVLQVVDNQLAPHTPEPTYVTAEAGFQVATNADYALAFDFTFGAGTQSREILAQIRRDYDNGAGISAYVMYDSGDFSVVVYETLGWNLIGSADLDALGIAHDQWHSLRLTGNGTAITLHIDDQLVVNVTESLNSTYSTPYTVVGFTGVYGQRIDNVTII